MWQILFDIHGVCFEMYAGLFENNRSIFAKLLEVSEMNPNFFDITPTDFEKHRADYGEFRRNFEENLQEFEISPAIAINMGSKFDVWQVLSGDFHRIFAS